MKKFLVLSSLVAVAGLGVGIATRQDPAPQATTTAAADMTTTTLAAEPATTSTTARAATKAATKTTATTARQVTAPANTAVAPAIAAPTTTTTVPATASTTATTVPKVSSSCTVTAANPSVHKGDSQTITILSNMPSNKTRLTIQYPKFDTGKPNPRLEYTLTTDAAGAATQSFSVGETSTVPVSVSVQIYDAAGHLVPGCQTTFSAS